MAVQPIKIPITAIDRTKKAFQSVTRSLNVVKKALFNFKVGITAAVGAAGLGLLVKRSLDSIDALGKTANKLGIATAELQKLRFASQLAGVETRTVDMAVQRFTRRLAEAANGTGEAKDALEELGINAASLSRQPLEKQMLALAAAFEKVEGSGDRVRLAFKLFDSEGVAFVNTLQAGEKALQDTFSEVDDLGVILSTNAVKGVESFNDSVVKLTTIFSGLVNTVAAGLAGPLQALVEMLTGKLKSAMGEGGKNVRNFTKELGHAVINATEVALKAFITFINETGSAIDKLRKEFIEFKEFFNIGVSVEELGRRMDRFNHFLGTTNKVLEETARLQGKLPSGFQAIKDAIDPLSDAASMSSGELLAVADALEKAIEKQREGAGATDPLVVAIRELADGVENVRKPYEKLFSEISVGSSIFEEMRAGLDRNTMSIEETGEAAAAAQDNLRQLIAAAQDAANLRDMPLPVSKPKTFKMPTLFVDKNRILLERGIREESEKTAASAEASLKNLEEHQRSLSRGFLGVNEALQQGKGPLEAYSESTKNLRENLENTAVRGLQRMEDALLGLVDGTMSVKDAFRSMASSIIKDLMRIAIQRQILGPIADAIFGATTGPSYSMGSSPQTYGLEKRANGGPVSAGRPYLVGERGPELMVPNRSGTVVPNNAMGGGVTINQTVQITTGVQQTVRAEVMNMLPDIANATKGAVLDARRRGGSFAAAFG